MNSRAAGLWSVSRARASSSPTTTARCRPACGERPSRILIKRTLAETSRLGADVSEVRRIFEEVAKEMGAGK